MATEKNKYAGRRKPTCSYGAKAEVIVTATSHDCTGQIGSVLHEISGKTGYYLVRFDDGAAEVFADDMDLHETEATIIPKGPQPIPQTPPQDIPLTMIIADPQQPRKHFDKVAMAEMVESIREHGVLQAIVVRKNPYLVHEEPYCIVFGERRWRAAKEAGLVTIPASVREMTDMQALELQLVENSQRRDVHPMEEGKALKKLIDSGSDIETLSHRLGVSTKYIATRIKLNDLSPLWQAVYTKGNIGLAHAVKLSKLNEQTQGMLYKDSSESVLSDGKWNLWGLDSKISEAQRNLSNANFDTEDPELNPEMGACSKCVFNTSNTPRLFLGDESICTNNACFGIKEKNSFKRRIETVASDASVVFLDNAPYKDSDDKKKVSIVEEIGGKVIGRNKIMQVITDPGPKPVWEDYLAEQKAEFEEYFDEGDDPFDEADARNEFNDALSSWEESMAEYEAAQLPGVATKAFVLTGHGAGEYVDVVLRSNNPGAATIDVNEQIASLQKEELAAKAVDNEKVYKQVVPLIKAHEHFVNNTTPITREETCALALYLLDYCSYSTKEWLANEMGIKEFRNSEAEYFAVLLKEMLQGTMNMLIRRVIADRVVDTSTLDYGKASKAAAGMAIARHYLPDEVNTLVLQQKEKSIKRSERVAAQIQKLKDSLKPATEPKKLRSEVSRMVIKVQSQDDKHAWKKLEGGFANADALEKRYQELLATGEFIEG